MRNLQVLHDGSELCKIQKKGKRYRRTFKMDPDFLTLRQVDTKKVKGVRKMFGRSTGIDSSKYTYVSLHILAALKLWIAWKWKVCASVMVLVSSPLFLAHCCSYFACFHLFFACFHIILAVHCIKAWIWGIRDIWSALIAAGVFFRRNTVLPCRHVIGSHIMASFGWAFRQWLQIYWQVAWNITFQYNVPGLHNLSNSIYCG